MSRTYRDLESTPGIGHPMRLNRRRKGKGTCERFCRSKDVLGVPRGVDRVRRKR